jgi:putative transposase
MGAYLRLVEHWPVHQQRRLGLRREPPLLVQPRLRLRAKRTPTGSTPRPANPHEWWGIEMTKGMVTGFGWLSIVVVLDWYTKKIVGYDAGVPCPATHGLAALDLAVHQQCPDGARGQGLSLMSDHGCQPPSIVFMEACSTMEIHPAFTSDHHPKGHAATERCMRTLKEECLWWQEWTCPLELTSRFARWVGYDNGHDLQSSVGNKTPNRFERDYDGSHGPPFLAA